MGNITYYLNDHRIKCGRHAGRRSRLGSRNMNLPVLESNVNPSLSGLMIRLTVTRLIMALYPVTAAAPIPWQVRVGHWHCRGGTLFHGTESEITSNSVEVAGPGFGPPGTTTRD
jgi:hypothetical protein